MDNSRIYHQATAGLLLLEALPPILSPSMAGWIVSADSKPVTDLESLVARELGFTLLLVSFLTLLLSGELHRLWNDADNIPAASATANTPYSSATTIATTLYHLTIGILLYVATASTRLSGTPLTLGALAHLGLAGAGLLVLVFAGEGKISKRTGADKRTSGFPFKNSESMKKHS